MLHYKTDTVHKPFMRIHNLLRRIVTPRRNFLEEIEGPSSIPTVR